MANNLPERTGATFQPQDLRSLVRPHLRDSDLDPNSYAEMNIASTLRRELEHFVGQRDTPEMRAQMEAIANRRVRELMAEQGVIIPGVTTGPRSSMTAEIVGDSINIQYPYTPQYPAQRDTAVQTYPFTSVPGQEVEAVPSDTAGPLTTEGFTHREGPPVYFMSDTQPSNGVVVSSDEGGPHNLVLFKDKDGSIEFRGFKRRPNWFFRLMQKLILGFIWEKEQ